MTETTPTEHGDDALVTAARAGIERARATGRTRLLRERRDWQPGSPPIARERAILRSFPTACDMGDMVSLAAQRREDAVLTMPPDPLRFASFGLPERL